MHNKTAPDVFYQNDLNFRKADLKPLTKNICFKKLTEVAPAIWVIDNQISKEDCQGIIETFEEDNATRPGVCGDGKVYKFIKDSTDLMINGQDPKWRKYDQILFKSLTRAKATILDELMMWMGVQKTLFDYDTGYQIQKTVPGGRYKWHTEAEGLNCAERSLVFTWYLNEVEQGGHTGFVRQGVSVEPRPGRLCLFSPYWTHIHAGIPVEKGTKYLITGWLHAGR